MTTLKLPTLQALDEALEARGLWIDQKAIPADSLTDLPALSRIASRLEPTLRRVFITAVRATQNAIDLENLAQGIQSGRLGDRLNALARLDVFERRIAGYDGPLRRGFLRGAGFANQTLQGAGLTMNFELMNAHAAEFSRRYVPELVGNIARGGREQVQRIITDSVTFGQTAQTAARRIRSTIGFTARDSNAFQKIEQELEALNLAGEITDIQLERKLERAAKALINRRAKVIARTEIIRATNAGQQELWDEAVTQGLIDRRTTKKKWIATDDELLEEICRGLDGTLVGLDEAFADGSMYPPSHPNCRCSLSLEFDQ